MRYPRKHFLGFTWVGWLNVLVLQWFCIRLQGMQYYYQGFTYLTWQIRFCYPLTGWWSKYKPAKKVWDLCEFKY